LLEGSGLARPFGAPAAAFFRSLLRGIQPDDLVEPPEAMDVGPDAPTALDEAMPSHEPE